MRTIVKNEKSGKEFLVSSRFTFDHGLETMVFAYDSARNDVIDWMDLYANNYRLESEMLADHERVAKILKHEELRYGRCNTIDNLYEE